ncbi:MAG: 2-hydroxyacyl-CoA dehydratase family protein, partial [Dehalococcoidia bacterium]
MSDVKYETKPLQCWQKAKEMIAGYYRDVATAREQGKVLVAGGSSAVLPLPAGLGDYVFFGAEPYAAVVSTDPQFSLECAEHVEAMGFARDLCSYMRNYWGSMFLDRYFFGGKFPKPDFCFTSHMCDSHAKWFQVVAEHLQVPYVCIDVPLVPARYGRLEQKTEYLISQLWDAIEWMEKVTGREYDDERLIEAVNNECRSLALQGEICLLQQAIPAPLTQKSMFSLYIIPHLLGHNREGVEFCLELRDELKDRVAQRIAGLATERCRLMDDAQPPWYSLKLYRYFEEYGATVIGSHYSYYLGGNLVEAEDGTLVAPKLPAERGRPMKTREDALRAMVEFYLEKPV